MGNIISYKDRKKKSLNDVKHYKNKEVKLKQESIDELIKKYLEG